MQTGDRDVDAVTLAIADRDSAALQSLFKLTSIACVEQTTYGGPPQCNEVPGSPPVGTEVQAFWYRPAGSCEFSWVHDITPLVSILASGGLDLYAVIEHSEDDFEVVFETTIGETTRGLSVAVQMGRIIELDYLCFGPPSTALESPGPGEHVILYGPAYP
jgi:hypothetical protein